MGRMDEALRRSNLDVGLGTISPLLPTPVLRLFDPHEDNDDDPTQPPSQCTDEATNRPASGEEGRLRYAGLDPVAAERLVVSNNASPLLVEQFRSLAATLLQAQIERSLRSLIVTSASPGDGKSYVALNLALTLSDSYKRRVLLIDADLRRPTLHAAFRVRNVGGLTDALKAKDDAAVAVVHVSDTLMLLPAGRAQSNPLSDLSSERMKHIVANAATQFDWVIVDSPPVGFLADGRLVSETVDAALLVVRAGATAFPDLQAAIDSVGHDRILGVVFNAVDPAHIRGQGYYHHYYGSGG